jgi:histidinol-phosphate phosphatase family protein
VNQPTHATAAGAVARPAAQFFDLGGTLLALDGHDEIAGDAQGRVTVLPGVRERLSALAGTPVFVVTNQSGLADGRLTRARFDGYCAQLSAAVGGAITAFAVCDHAHDAGCACRKPKPGLILALAEAHDLDLAASTMTGDTETDRRLAAAAGVGHFRWASDVFGAA